MNNYKYLEGIIRESLCDLGDSDYCLYIMSKYELGKIVDKLNFIKIEIFCFVRDIVKRMR